MVSKWMINTVGGRRGLIILAALNILIIFFFWGQTSGSLLLLGGPDSLIALGRIAGLLTVLLVLGQVFMISRVRWLEQRIGFDGITRYHHRNGQWLAGLLVAHPTLLSIGYGMALGVSPVEQLTSFIFNWPYVAFAAIAICILVIIIAVAALRPLRSRLTYEQWYTTHLFVYVAVLLAYFHQIPNGADFGSQLFRYYWYGLYVVAFGSLIYFRFLMPIINSMRHQFVVTRVEKDTDNSVSIYVGGANMEQFRYRGGQFAVWAFWQKGFPLQKHPFTISQEYNGKELRLTAKGVGDFTRLLPRLKKGARVFVEGPYGIFTPNLSKNKKILMIAGGAGITPLRAMLPDMLLEGRDIKMLYGNQTAKDAMLQGELNKLSENANFSYVNVFSDDSKAKEKGFIDADRIKRLIPDFKSRDIYICGPPAMIDAVTKTLIHLGVSRSQIYSERFSL